MTKIPEEVVERMCVLVRDMGAYYDQGSTDTILLAGKALDWMRDAHPIAVLLPEPVDPDLIEARQIAAASERDDEFLHGDYDHGSIILNFLKAIKRGRELERSK